MSIEFKDKNYWAVILGGSAGLGLASAKKLAMHGMNICIVHRDRKLDLPIVEQNFNEIKSNGVDFLSFNLDALKPETRDEVISKLKEHWKEKSSVRVLIHSIAKGNLKPMISENVAALNNDDFHLTSEAMAFSLYDWTKNLYICKLFSPDARVISFTSEGNLKAWKNYAAVSAAKGALEAITRNIALEFAPYGIRANCIQAGATDTNSFRMIPGHKELAEYAKIRNPYKRLTKPEDVADAVYLLSLDEASWINGAVIPVNGGEHLS
ncbi:MAG TPA: SDR family oxidoreductase [Ignavibacteriaceae bacterium]|nr:SDR family oxidoreductase [Ignavibacteriaceae bacterium]